MKHIKRIHGGFWWILFLSHPVFAEKQHVTVADPFLEMRTGPGRGYPVFHIAEQGEQVEIEKRRTDWFKIKTTDRHTKQGWVHLSEMQRTTDPAGAYIVFPGASRADVTGRRWEWSVSGGDFGGVNSISTAVSFHVTQNIATQLQFSQILGDFSNSKMLVASVQHSPFPHWRLSPYFQMGTGILETDSFSTIVQAEDSRNQTINVGVGANIYLSRRFMSYIDYRYHTVLTSLDSNKEIHEWKIGISAFF